jgi:hypothetical protein
MLSWQVGRVKITRIVEMDVDAVPAAAGVHRLRLSDCNPGGLDLFGVLAARI